MKVHRLAALAAILAVGAVTPSANAVSVTYSTAGVFGSSGTALLDQGGAQIRFDPIATTVDDPMNTNAPFGAFVTVAAPPSPGVTLVDTFTLTITQTSPAPGGDLVFESTVGGTIFLNNSRAFIQFDTTTLQQSINSGGFLTTYRIVEGDEANPGRLEFFGGVNQVSTLNGEISITEIAPVPEPGTMALACLALPMLGLGYVRNRRRVAQV